MESKLTTTSNHVSRNTKKSKNFFFSASKHFCFATLIILLMGWSYQSQAQSFTPCSTAVKIGNFGVDGDFYANTPASLGNNDDDWFNSTLYPGAGFGVI